MALAAALVVFLYLLVSRSSGPQSGSSVDGSKSLSADDTSQYKWGKPTTCLNATKMATDISDMKKWKVHSQNYQDAIIDWFFKIVQPKNKYYVEFGFNKPDYATSKGMNTRYLNEQGWKGLLLDGFNAAFQRFIATACAFTQILKAFTQCRW